MSLCRITGVSKKDEGKEEKKKKFVKFQNFLRKVHENFSERFRTFVFPFLKMSVEKLMETFKLGIVS